MSYDLYKITENLSYIGLHSYNKSSSEYFNKVLEKIVRTMTRRELRENESFLVTFTTRCTKDPNNTFGLNDRDAIYYDLSKIELFDDIHLLTILRLQRRFPETEDIKTLGKQRMNQVKLVSKLSLKSYNNTGAFKCYVCNRNFTTNKNLQEHYKSKIHNNKIHETVAEDFVIKEPGVINLS